jgi:UPF0755 protein
MRKQIKLIIFLVLAVLLAVQISYWRGINNPVDKNGQDKIFVVKKGESVKQISDNLKRDGLIKSKLYFEIYVWRENKEKNLQAGEYVLSPNLTIKEIVRILSAGEALSDELTIKIIEGWSVADIDKYLAEMGLARDNEFIQSVKGDFRFQISDFRFLSDKPEDVGLEGFLFPDTYRIFKDATVDDIIKKMLDNFDRKLTKQMRDDIRKQGKTIYEIITMASIIEKEVRTPEDMKIVSGIFWDRVKNGQALESCATLAYITGVNKQQYSIEDTKIDSPYNTYKYPGLPPTPICNPGLNAIQAAIYPKYTDYNYFLSRPDTGETIFSKTYDEHLKNKAKYLN